MIIAVVVLAAAAASFAIAWWRERDEVSRLRAITDPDRFVCWCGHDDVMHSTYGGCREARCSCPASAREVRAAAARRRTHMTRLDIQDH